MEKKLSDFSYEELLKLKIKLMQDLMLVQHNMLAVDDEISKREAEKLKDQNKVLADTLDKKSQIAK